MGVLSKPCPVRSRGAPYLLISSRKPSATTLSASPHLAPPTPTVHQVVLSEVVGVLRMRVFLSGMPECKLGLNDKVLFENQGRAGKQKTVELEDIKFHQ